MSMLIAKKHSIINLKISKMKKTISVVSEDLINRKGYNLCKFTDVKGYAYILNIKHNIIHQIIGRRFDSDLKKKYPHLSDLFCSSFRKLKLSELSC